MACDVTAEQLRRFAAGEMLDEQTARRIRQLAEYAAGEGDAATAAGVEEHLATCAECRRHVAALRRAESALAALPAPRASAGALLAIRRELAREVRGAGAGPEVMTLDEVAAFLRLSPGQLDEVVSDLPGFELAGQIRVRRTRLLAWIERREREYLRNTVASRVASALAANGWKGVA